MVLSVSAGSAFATLTLHRRLLMLRACGAAWNLRYSAADERMMESSRLDVFRLTAVSFHPVVELGYPP
ncbi:MAG: hypothetical protein FWC38_07915, partial [Proteobacteria bacterium]|nr:hypothetical protein [Pseudomonadota bacterium]